MLISQSSLDCDFYGRTLSTDDPPRHGRRVARDMEIGRITPGWDKAGRFRRALESHFRSPEGLFIDKPAYSAGHDREVMKINTIGLYHQGVRHRPS